MSLLAALSPRQREVARLVAEGLTSKQVALRLGITWRTVDTHRRKILHKLKMPSFVHVARALVLEELTTKGEQHATSTR